jgi:enamine deaminase RidA (YjgF/YER057c/UK114 family)
MPYSAESGAIAGKLITKLAIMPGIGNPSGIAAQMRLALRNPGAILTAIEASMATLVKTTIIYRNVDDFVSIDEIYASHMADPPPARSAPANVRFALQPQSDKPIMSTMRTWL